MTTPAAHPALASFVDRVSKDLGDRLVAVVLYGSAARGDFVDATSDFNVLVVASDLEPATLERLSGAFEAWRQARQPVPRVFSPALIAASVDVFPIEYFEILELHVTLAGRDPFAGLTVRRDFLRLQCERELREKMMRLREAYIELASDPARLERLLVESYSSFGAIFRGCLRMTDDEIPVAMDEVVQRFSARAGVDASAFFDIAALRHGNRVDAVKELFARYYAALSAAVAYIDGLARTS